MKTAPHHPTRPLHNASLSVVFRYFTLWLALAGGWCSVFAQTYPVYVTPSLTPPYSLQLSDYGMTGSQQLVVTIMVRDATISNLPVKLRIKIENSAAGVAVETMPTITTMPLYLNGGQAVMLFGADLADYFNINNLVFTGYSKEQYLRTGQLPEGFYKFTVDVLHHGTGRVISNHGMATAWIALGKPPVLKIPDDKAEVGQFIGMPLTFSWLPSNVGVPSAGVHYLFELWELRIPGIDPQVIAASMPALHTVQQPHTTLLMQPAELFLEQGMRYAWRVTVSDPMGKVPFAQDGHSEVRTFTYQAHCDTVTGFVTEQQAQQGTFRWEAGANHTSFNVELRNPATGYFRQSQTFDNKVTYPDLDYGSTYQLRAQAVCNGDPQQVSAYSAWHTLTIPALRVDTTSCPDCRCGEEPPKVSIKNRTLRTDLQPGDTISNAAGSTRFILKTAEPQGDGVYKGLFWFWAEIWKVKILCEYWDLSVNTDNVILKMDYESVSNPQFLLDVDAAKNYIDSLANVIVTTVANTTIKDTIALDTSEEVNYTNEADTVMAVTENPGGVLTETPSQANDTTLNTASAQDTGEEDPVAMSDGMVAGGEEFTQESGDAQSTSEEKEEEEETGQIIIDKKHTKLFNHVYANNLNPYKAGAGTYQSEDWDTAWTYSDDNPEELVDKTIKKVRDAASGQTVPKITLRDNGIYISKLTIDNKEYATAMYSRKKAIGNITKITVASLDELQTDSIRKHLYCERTHAKYLVLAFYEGDEGEPVLMLQAAKDESEQFSDTHLEAWIKYVGVMEEIKQNQNVDTEKVVISIMPTDLFERQADKNCFETCVDIIKKYDPEYQIPTVEIWALATKDNKIVKLHKDCCADALIALDNEISSGNPVIVGVDYKKNDPAINFDKITDHWVIINGKGSDDKGVFYTYFEVAQPNNKGNNRGTSTDRNRFYVNEHHQLIGLFPTVNGNENTPVITSLRIIPNNKCCSRKVYEKINDNCTDYYIHKTNSKGSLIEIKR